MALERYLRHPCTTQIQRWTRLDIWTIPYARYVKPVNVPYFGGKKPSKTRSKLQSKQGSFCVPGIYWYREGAIFSTAFDKTPKNVARNSFAVLFFNVRLLWRFEAFTRGKQGHHWAERRCWLRSYFGFGHWRGQGFGVGKEEGRVCGRRVLMYILLSLYKHIFVNVHQKTHGMNSKICGSIR